VIGGWNTRTTIFEIKNCGLFPLRFKLPRDYRVHSCEVHGQRLFLCGSRDSPKKCDSFDAAWHHRVEPDTNYPHSYGSLTSTSGFGLTIIGGVAPVIGRNNKVEFLRESGWIDGPELPSLLSSHTSHTIEGGLYVFGGLVSDAGQFGRTDSVYTLQRGATKWKKILPLSFPRSHHASVLLPNNRVALLGDPYGVVEMEIYDLTNSTSPRTSLVKNIYFKQRAFPAALYLNKPVC
jgi:hypothetical protein